MRTAVIMQPTYLPWPGYFDLMDQSDIFVFLDSVQFDKRSWQQRNRIKSAAGEQMLTVPVFSKGQFSQNIYEVHVDHSSNFIESHIKAIQLNYAKSKYFSRYFNEITKILRKRHVLLCDLNIEIILWIKEMFGLKAEILRSSSLNVQGNRVALLADICRSLGASHYLSPKGSMDYITRNNLFDEYGIQLSYQNYEPVPYRQLYGEFVPCLSTLDLLFNEGEQSLNIIRAGRKLNKSLIKEEVKCQVSY